MPHIPTILSVTAFSALLAGVVAAAPSGDGDRCPPPPPREAVEACAKLDAGDACSFESPHGTVEGECFLPEDAPDDAPLACKPDAPPPDHR
jgi:hypothetical protein